MYLLVFERFPVIISPLLYPVFTTWILTSAIFFYLTFSEFVVLSQGEGPGRRFDRLISQYFLNNFECEDVVAEWCNPMTLQSEQSGGVGSIPGRAPTLERRDKGLRTRLAPPYFCDPSVLR